MRAAGRIAQALAGTAARRPVAVLAAWAVAVGGLALVGLGVEERLHRSDLTITGSPADRALTAAAQEFGEQMDLIVLLRGPAEETARQGRRVARDLDRRPGLVVQQRPSRGEPGLLLVVRAAGSFEHVSRDVVPSLRATVDRAVRPPVTAHVSGQPDIAQAIHGGSVEAIRRAELIAAPFLCLVLLLVFRSVVAAVVPLLAGGGTVAASTGVLSLLNEAVALDALALNLASMMGLALGVDYGLLLVSRCREHMAAGEAPRAAAVAAAGTAGHTVLVAGVVLAGAMLAALAVAPGDLLASASAGTGVAVVLGVLGALTAVPAMLVLLGRRIDALAIGRRGGRGEPGWAAALAGRALRRPLVAAGCVLLFLAVMAFPVLGMRSGPPDPRTLPADSRERQDFEAIRSTLGGGWVVPYEVLLRVPSGVVTDPRRLRALERWERRLAARPEVQAVLGAGRLEREVRPLQRVPARLARARRALERGKADQRRLADGLARAGDGSRDLRAGLDEAAAGAAALRAGGSSAATGGQRLAGGLARARAGARGLRDGLRDARGGAQALRRGARRLRAGAGSLAEGVRRTRRGSASAAGPARELAAGLDAGAAGLQGLREPARRAEAELGRALDALDRMLPSAKVDPRYREAYAAVATAAGAVTGRHPRTGAPVRDGYPGLDAALAEAAAGVARGADGAALLAAGVDELRAGLRRLGSGAVELERGTARLTEGSGRLLAGLDALDAGAGDLDGGLGRLRAGAAALGGGLVELEDGSARLAGGLAAGARRTGALEGGLARMRGGVGDARRRTAPLERSLAGADDLGRTLGSGFAVLAAVDAAPRHERSAAGFVVNVDGGGSAARIVVIGRGEAHRAGHPLRGVLERELPALERATGGEAFLGGPAMVLQDFDRATAGRLPWLAVALSTVTTVLLALALRAVLLAVVAVALNLLSVGAALGVLVMLFQGDDPLLGGPGVLDAITVAGVFSIVFALSIDYAVFLLSRMREAYDRTGSPAEAIAAGVQRTARVVTGAALIMCAVFSAFATTPMVNLRQIGIGLTVAVIVDATLVRLVLLPATIRLLGRAAWWWPGGRRPRLRRPPAPTPEAA